METLERDVERMRRRMRILIVERRALTAGTGGAAAAAVLVLLSKWVYPLGEPALLWGLVLAGLAAGAVWGMLVRLTPFAAARAAEARLDLKERLSSAVALADSEDEMVRALTQDAASHIHRVRPRDVFRHRFTREMAAFAAAVFVTVALFYVPQIPMLQSPTRRAEVRVMKREGKRIRRLAKEAPKRVSPENKQIVKQLAINMERLGRKLESGRMTRKQAMLSAKRLSKEIKDAQDRIASRSASRKSLVQAAQDLRDFSPELARRMLERIEKERARTGKVDPKLNEFQKRLEDMQARSGGLSERQVQEYDRKLSEFLSSQAGVPVPPELAALIAELLANEDYRRATEILSQLAKKLGSGNLSKTDLQNLEEQLKALAEALKGTDLAELARRLREAAEALAKMDPKEAAKLLAQCNNLGLPTDLAMLGKMGGT